MINCILGEHLLSFPYAFLFVFHVMPVTNW